MRAGDGMCASGLLCAGCLPEPGDLPPLPYQRIVFAVTGELAFEALNPMDDHACGQCGDRALVKYEQRCPGCADPEYRTTQRHQEHALAVRYACPDHRTATTR
jgi:hypothetical protein